MPILFVSHPGYVEHDWRGHPERPERLVAVEIGAELSGLDSELVKVAARPATEGDRAGPHAHLRRRWSSSAAAAAGTSTPTRPRSRVVGA